MLWNSRFSSSLKRSPSVRKRYCRYRSRIILHNFFRACGYVFSFTSAKLIKISGYVPCSLRNFSLSHTSSPSNSSPLPAYCTEKNFLQHTHIQSLTKSSRARDQGHTVPSLPPFPDKTGLINVKILPCPYHFKVLISDTYCLCHVLFHSLLYGPHIEQLAR